MTPDWIHSNFIITGPYELYRNQYYEIPVSNVTEYNQQTLQLQLVSPGILSSTDSVTVTITVAMDTKVANKEDQDPQFGISDEKSFIGFQIPDRGNYHKLSPCLGDEADIINATLTNQKFGSGSLVASRCYSSEVRLQIKLKEKWGSCHTEHNEGYTNIANYQHQLDLSEGLYLEMYRSKLVKDIALSIS